MKKIARKYSLTFFTLILIFVFQGCKEMKENTSELVLPESFYTDDISMQAGIVGIHRSVADVWTLPNWSIQLCGDDILTSTNAVPNKEPFRIYDQFKNTRGGEPWETDYVVTPLYAAIRDANSFIEGVEKNFSTIRLNETEFKINQRLGEAKFLRALCYFALVRVFGDIPYTENTLFQDENTRKLNKRVVYDRIIKDLEFAGKYCVSAKVAAGQVTKWSAFGTLAQVTRQTNGYK